MVRPTVAGDLQRTPLYEQHKALGAKLVPFAGWEMPVQYDGIIKEHHAVRQHAGLFDVSHMGELELTGPRAEAVVNGLVTNDVGRAEPGRAVYTACCNEQGTILDDFIVYRRGPERFLVICNASNRDKIAGHFRKAAEGRCEFRDLTEHTALLALQGPAAAEILRQAGADEALCSLGPFRIADGQVGGVSAAVARTGYTGEDGFELAVANEDAAKLWQSLMNAGESHRIEPAGLGARDTLRLEARLALYGNDIDETTNPYEAGLGWVVKLDKGEFVGRQALRKIKDEGPRRKLVGFEMTARGIARHGYPIVDEQGTEIGVVTSGSPGPTVGKNIGLGYVPKEHGAIGTKIGVQIRGKVVEAVVVKTPFYKRQK